jgi:hypothetical protein
VATKLSKNLVLDFLNCVSANIKSHIGIPGVITVENSGHLSVETDFFWRSFTKEKLFPKKSSYSRTWEQWFFQLRRNISEDASHVTANTCPHLIQGVQKSWLYIYDLGYLAIDIS